MRKFDVCIVGAGPAGIAASTVLNRAGARVALLTKPRAFPRATESRWETLSSRVEPILVELGLREALRNICKHRVTAHVSSWGSNEVAWEPVMKRPGGGSWIVNRNDFDLALRAAAAAQGVVIIETETINNLERAGQYWRLALGDTKNFDLTSSFLIDATGYGAAIARRLGAKRVIVDKLVAHWLVFPTESDAEQTVRIDALEDGWIFTIKGGEQRLLCFFTDGNLLERRSGMSTEHVIGERIRAAPAIQSLLDFDSIPPISAFGVTFAATSALYRAVGDCWLACGDAAQTYDPLSSQGSYQALLSGCQAGGSLIDYHDGDLQALDNYNYLRQIKFFQYLKTLCKQYRLEHRWTKSDFWARRHRLFNSKAVQQLHDGISGERRFFSSI